ncbi:MAG: hypothetical protein EXS64_04495 [Candidatus Latescibacteria bacterium]|nr:hypothetical protein [Candidatus Latescibacterota bacterium]
MSVLTAVETVLAEVGAPLHYCEITRRIVERGLWTPEGKTPEATVRSCFKTRMTAGFPVRPATDRSR